MNLNDNSKLFKALGDNNRLEILNLLSSGEKCACDLLEYIKLSQPALSHHMKILEEARIVNSVKRGKWVFYSINKESLVNIRNFLQEIIGS